MMLDNPPALSQRLFRSRIAERLQRKKGKQRHQIIFALDGIPWSLAQGIWQHPTIERWQAVFPSTSATCWLSSLTGLSVAEHGVPGVVFCADDQQNSLINICDYQGDALNIPQDNIFRDASRSGYLPQAVAGDLLPIEGAWTRALLNGALFIDPTPFFTRTSELSPRVLLHDLQTVVDHAVARATSPALVWIFIDVDHYIHSNGYDSLVSDFLAGIERLALRLNQIGYDVIAHSDHGLVPVLHDADVERFILRACEKYSVTMGGAGLTRWFYVPDDKVEEFQHHLAAELGDIADILIAKDLDDMSERAGSVFLIARGERFIAPDGWRYEHGSRQHQELDVFYAVWEE